ncbi:MAG: adenylate/guanylate cyclase domain-containing protein [Jatrophihabitans sp.]|uniref:adenylate/guanylate cyclase domain-containing protein n=1 Tax=Jatrophihabitans sp. TaxID=1932789 RepID=UPI003F7E17FE
MADAVPDDLDLRQLVERLERLVLQGERRFTADEAAVEAGLTLDEARQLWHSLGFATEPDEQDERLFGDSDVEAMRLVQHLEAFGLDSAELRSSMTRFFGQTFSRLASMEGQILLDHLAKNPEVLASADGAVALADEVLPVLERLQNYVWRRQLASYLSRIAATADEGVGASDDVCVGFADLAGFTSLTRRLDEKELRSLLERFESLAGDIVATNGGRIVKTIGDEVLFTVEDPRCAAEIALQLLAAADGHDDMPDLRIGVARGPIVRRMGDVFGATVNIASRLTKLVRPGNVLVDRAMSEALEALEGYELRSLRPADVRGYHRLHSWRLRRAER